MRVLERTVRSLKNILHDEQIVGLAFAALIYLRYTHSDRGYRDPGDRKKQREELSKKLLYRDCDCIRGCKEFDTVIQLYDELQLPGNRDALLGSEEWEEFLKQITDIARYNTVSYATEYILECLADFLPFLQQFILPQGVAQLMSELIGGLDGKRVLYPYCGYGPLLPQLKCSTSSVIYGFEQNRAHGTLAAVYAALCNGSEFLLNRSDMLQSSRMTGYDAAVAVLPFDNKQSSQLSWEVPSMFRRDDRYSSAPQIWSICESLSEGGSAVLMVPNGVLFRMGNDLLLRERLLECGWLHAVIHLPPRLLGHTSVPCCILVIRKGTPKQEVILIDAAGNEDWFSGGRQISLTAQAVSEIPKLLENGGDSRYRRVVTPREQLRLDRQFYFAAEQSGTRENIPTDQLRAEAEQAFNDYCDAHKTLTKLLSDK